MAEPEEVAKLVEFPASDDAEFIDGEVVKIDGMLICKIILSEDHYGVNESIGITD